MKKLLTLIVASGISSIGIFSGTEAISQVSTRDLDYPAASDMKISCGGGGSGNSAKKRAQKKAIQAELRKMIEEKKKNKEN